MVPYVVAEKVSVDNAKKEKLFYVVANAVCIEGLTSVAYCKSEAIMKQHIQTNTAYSV